MPVYNGEKYLAEAMDSILNQSFTDFEFLIINDGSTDQSVKIIESYQDSRIRLIHNEKNIGLAETCNKGIEMAKGELVARMDSDDISLPKRLEKQIKFMDNNPEVGICGTWIRMFGSVSYINRYFTGDQELKARLLFNTCFAHPSVVMKKNILIKNNLKYKKEFDPGDDYYLWAELSNFTNFANIPEILLLYRMHSKNISKIKNNNQAWGAKNARLHMLDQLEINPSEEDMQIHSHLKDFTGNPILFLDRSESWMSKLIKANQEQKIFDEESLFKIIYDRWFSVCYNNSHLGFSIWKKFWQSPLSSHNKNWIQLLKFLLKTITSYVN